MKQLTVASHVSKYMYVCMYICTCVHASIHTTEEFTLTCIHIHLDVYIHLTCVLVNMHVECKCLLGNKYMYTYTCTGCLYTHTQSLDESLNQWTPLYIIVHKNVLYSAT